jgi:AraC-like DNA-binding protein
MEKVTVITDAALSPFINCIMIDECTDEHQETKIPVYADGYPGIMFIDSSNDFYRQPATKKLSKLFLYGQTLDKITLETTGIFSSVTVQLYPFASKYLLGIDPKELNDDCYDLLQITDVPVADYYQRLQSSDSLKDRVKIISELITALIEHQDVAQHDEVQSAIHQIIAAHGAVKMKDVQATTGMSERTFERAIKQETGLTPKQFARIIQFQYSVDELKQEDDSSLTAISMSSGFSDQSHFIRVFKEYTGITPSAYLTQAHA